MEPELFRLHAAIEEEHWWFVGRRQIMRTLLAEILPPHANSRVVDVGCGTGANIASLADAYEVLGIDTTPEAIRLSQDRFPGVTFVCGRAPQDLGERASHVDAFLLMDVLEHVAEPRALLAELTNALRPGGFVLITVPADMRLWSAHDVSFGHFLRYEMATFRDLWKDLPVRERLVSCFNSRLYPIVFAIRKVTAWRNRPWGGAGSDLSMPPSVVNDVLARILAGESRRLARAMRGEQMPYRRGVSLVAILERGMGDGA